MDFLQKLSIKAIQQSDIWKNFQQSIGRECFWVDEILITKIPLPFNYCWFLVSKPFLTQKNNDSFWQKIIDLAKTQRTVYIRFENPSEKITDFLKNLKFQTAKKSYLPETTLILDLTQTEEEILKQMKPKGRYNIKLAQKKGLTIENFNYQDEKKLKSAIANFHQILKETASRDKFFSHDQDYYLKMLLALKNHAKLYLAKYENKYIAGIITTQFQNTVIYYYGASSSQHRAVMAPYLLQWTAIQAAKKNGFEIYDFLGIAPTSNYHSRESGKKHPLQSVTDFKLKFGGIIISYPESKEYIFKPFLNKI